MAAVERDIDFTETKPTYARVTELVERARKFPDRENDHEFHEELGRIERYVRLFLGLEPRGNSLTPEMLNQHMGEQNIAMFRARFQQIGIIM